MFLEHYKLIEQPFGVTPDSRFLYLGPKHREALASLLYATESNRGFVALVAKPGMGKTTLLYHYLSYLRGKARTAFVFHTDCDSRDFIRHVLLDLGIDVSRMDLPAMHEALNRVLTEEMRAGRRFVLVVDEAQNLEEKVLESIRLLSNFETPCAKLMQIILAGQPQLADHLASPSMAQLCQRISMVVPIEALTPQEANAYIDHRLWVAGSDKRSIFTVGARKLVAEHSEGIPRNINNLCFHAMSAGYALKRSTIDRDIILDVIADLDLERLRAKPIAAKPSAFEAKSLPIRLSVPTIKASASARWAPQVAVAAGILLLLGWPLFRVSRGAHGPSALPSVTFSAPSAGLLSPTPIPLSVAPPQPPFPSVKALVPQVPDLIQMKPGQTLYQISLRRFGRYDQDVLSQFRELNPWLTNPDHIESGRKILVPPAVISGNEQRAAEQSTNVPPAEADKP
ncbi:MAG TPA: AAA family ATPase [Verrucomicrobiae bacterium]|nr:AAA family ATPase [Verrucomicrobiae bacterium]